MKALLKLLIFTLLTSATGLAGCASQPPRDQNSLAQAQNVLGQNYPIKVFLPNEANLTLKKGGSMSGKLTAVDAQAQQINLELSGESETVAIADIEQVEFEGEVILSCGNTNCEIVIRGDQDKASPNNNRKTWSEPLTNFRVIDPNKGEAEIQLTSIPKLEWQGIYSVAQSSSYVVKEMQFESPGMMTIKVTPH